jgi:diaminopimelate epimerase
MQATKQDPLEFTKGGNDFVIIDNRTGRVSTRSSSRKDLHCTPSVGADGLILIENSPRADFRMRYFNNDGSGGEFCANGTRCAARYAAVNGIAPSKMTIDTDVGLVGAEAGEGTSITLSLPSPHNFRAERPVRLDDKVVRGSSIVMGVPHYVIFEGGDLWSKDIVLTGRADSLSQRAETRRRRERISSSCAASAIEVRTYERRRSRDTSRLGRRRSARCHLGDVRGSGGWSDGSITRRRSCRRRTAQRTTDRRRARGLPRAADSGNDRRL